MSEIAEAKAVLEAALLVAGEPVPPAQLAKLFEPALPLDTVRALLDELAREWSSRKVELVRRLLEYERMKQAAREIDALPLAERDFSTVRVWFDRLAGERLPDVSPDDLRAAWAGLIARARSHRHHLVTREQLSVRSEMSRLLKLLQPTRFLEFTAMFAEHADVAHLVVTFLALLELSREQLINVVQAEPYAPIYARLRSEAPFTLDAEPA